jgi:hypothetical protein
MEKKDALADKDIMNLFLFNGKKYAKSSYNISSEQDG